MPTLFPEKELQPKEIFAAVAPSVYLLLAGRSAGALWQGDGMLATAVAISADTALTNCHVVQNHSYIALADETSKQTFTATVTRSHSPTDRCFLRVEGKLRAISGVRTIASLAIGERVYTIGNPSGLTKTLGEGLISGMRLRQGITHVQTSAPMSRGSSGGALVDAKGMLVGITTFLLRDTQNLNFAIAAEEYWR
jgi:S1-C subfamily serine protease